jgi:ubiquitin carboxyl-terminal hydrolase 14
MVKVSVKWSSKKFDDLDLGQSLAFFPIFFFYIGILNGLPTDVDESPELFKNQIYSLTGVPPERQKIMIKGGTMKV